MKIIHTESSVNWGGQEYRVVDQMQWLAAAGHGVALAARPGSAIAARVTALKLPLIPIAYTGHYNPRAVLQLRRAMRGGRFEIADCHGSRDGATQAFARDLGAVVRTRHLSTPIKAKLHRRLQWQWGCDRVIATAQCIKDELAAKRFMAPDCIDVVGEWAAPEFFDIADKDRHRRAVRGEFAVPDGRAVVAVVGMLRGDKAQEVLIETAAEMRRRGRPIMALIVGGDTHSQAGAEAVLRAHAAALGIAEDVRFAGYRDDVARLTQAADLLVITSIAVEAQSRAAPQAFAAMTPVIASRVGGVAELVTPGETGWLVPPRAVGDYANAIEQALDDPSATGRIVRTARAFAERALTIDVKMTETLAAYGRALKTPAS
jgi:glycosyltransferase involved in cell wall biosynthesis